MEEHNLSGVVKEISAISRWKNKRAFLTEKMDRKLTEYKETNFENEARKKRYNFYEEILSKYHSTKLFLAHHGDDQIETVLMKIVRGSNLEGYAGIKEISKVKNYQIIRPLLKVTKEDIINYNKSHNITYFIDSSF